MTYKRHKNYKDQVAVYKQQLATAIGICDITIFIDQIKNLRVNLENLRQLGEVSE
ncbi:MAG: hypothetical protein ACTS8H_04305 [Arsenophonus sp. NC-PE1-MAG3]